MAGKTALVTELRQQIYADLLPDYENVAYIDDGQARLGVRVTLVCLSRLLPQVEPGVSDDNAAMPWVVFTDPQVAGVGLTEAGRCED